MHLLLSCFDTVKISLHHLNLFGYICRIFLLNNNRNTLPFFGISCLVNTRHFTHAMYANTECWRTMISFLCLRIFSILREEKTNTLEQLYNAVSSCNSYLLWCYLLNRYRISTRDGGKNCLALWHSQCSLIPLSCPYILPSVSALDCCRKWGTSWDGPGSVPRQPFLITALLLSWHSA